MAQPKRTVCLRPADACSHTAWLNSLMNFTLKKYSICPDFDFQIFLKEQGLLQKWLFLGRGGEVPAEPETHARSNKCSENNAVKGTPSNRTAGMGYCTTDKR